MLIRKRAPFSLLGPQFFVLPLLLVFALGAKAQTTGWEPTPGHTQIAIWPGTPPDAQPAAGPETAKTTENEKLVGGKTWIYVSNVSRPTMTVYPPEGKNTGAAVVVFPGGGYQILAIDLEGTEVCDWLTSRGITCVLLKYRVPNTGPHWEKKCDCQVYPKAPMALEDAQRTLRLVRFHAAEWHIDPHKIGVLGFSAGGHLVAATSTRFQERLYAPVDEADRESARPDFAVALYPGHLWMDEKKFKLNPEITVTRETPPTFLIQAENDNVDSINNTLVYYVALKNAGVPVEIHSYAEGGHAFGLRRTKFPITAWAELVERWLITVGMVPN
jgi:acetyl esterase/lipase